MTPESETTGQDRESFDELSEGESMKMDHRFETNLWGLGDLDYVGHEKQPNNIQVKNAEVVGTKSNERIKVELEADVKKVDPKTKPHFCTEDRWQEFQSEDKSNSVIRDISKAVLPPAIALAVSGYVGMTIMDQLQTAEINGQIGTGPDMGLLIPLMIAMVLAILISRMRFHHARSGK